MSLEPAKKLVSATWNQLKMLTALRDGKRTHTTFTCSPVPRVFFASRDGLLKVHSVNVKEIATSTKTAPRDLSALRDLKRRQSLAARTQQMRPVTLISATDPSPRKLSRLLLSLTSASLKVLPLMPKPMLPEKDS